MRGWVNNRRAIRRGRRLLRAQAQANTDYREKERQAFIAATALTEADWTEAEVWVTSARELIHALAAHTHCDDGGDDNHPIHSHDEVELITRARALTLDDPDAWPTPGRLAGRTLKWG